MVYVFPSATIVNRSNTVPSAVQKVPSLTANAVFPSASTMDFRARDSMKAPIPIELTFFPMVTVSSAEHPPKAHIPIDSTESGMTIDVRDSHIAKASHPMDSAQPRSMDSREGMTKACVPIDLTFVSFTVLIEVFPLNAVSPIDVTESGMTKVSSAASAEP